MISEHIVLTKKYLKMYRNLYETNFVNLKNSKKFTHKTVGFLLNRKYGRINAFYANDDKVHLCPYNGRYRIRIKDVLDEIDHRHLQFVYVYSNPFWNRNASHSEISEESKEVALNFD